MSWSVSAHGKPEAVGRKLAGDFERITYLSGVEQELMLAAAGIVSKACAANNCKDYSLKVTASGSGSHHETKGDTQSISIVIEPMYGFAE